MKVRAIYEDGVFKPLEKVDLEDGTEVELVFRVLQTTEPEDAAESEHGVGSP